MTKELKEALRTAKELPFHEQLRILAQTYLNHRQIGIPEAIYRLLPFMKLCKSSIGCKFVATGFPQNREVFFIPVKETTKEDEKADPTSENEDDNLEEDEGENVPSAFIDSEIFEIEGKEGKFKAGVSQTDQYANRPSILEEMTLAQFQSLYCASSRTSKKITWLMDKDNQSMISEQTSEDHKIFGASEDVQLPLRIKLRKNLGQMVLRKSMIVLRYYPSKYIDGFEQFYAEMLFLSPWRNEEEELFPNDETKCIREFHNRKDKISMIKKWLFPGDESIDIGDLQLLEENRPQHVYDNLNCQGEQENDDDNEVEELDDLEIAPLQWNGKEDSDDINPDSRSGKGIFKVVPLLKDDVLMKLTRMLVGEQKEALSKIVSICKDIVKERFRPIPLNKQLLFLIHGGAGK